MKNFFVILLFSVSSFAFARWHTSPTVNTPIVTAIQEQLNPSFASDGHGGAIIAWQDLRNEGTPNIYAQRVDAYGKIKWAQNGVAICMAANGQYNPIVVADTNGGAFIIWQDLRNASNYNAAANDTDIFIQHVDSIGKISWNLNGMPLCNKSSQKSDLIALNDENGGVFVAWEDYRNCLGYKDTAVDIRRPDQVPLFVIDTICTVTVNNPPRIYLQHVTINDSMWTVDTIGILSCDSTHRFSQTFPQFISDGHDGAFLTWQDNLPTSTTIRCQHFAPDGSMMLPDTGMPVSDYASDKDSLVAVSDNHGGFIAAWEDKRNYTNTGLDIYAQRVSDSGKIVWTQGRWGVPVITIEQDQFSPQLAADTAGNAFIVWQDRRNFYSTPNYFGIDLFGQMLNAADGTPKWTADGVGLVVAPQDQFNQQILSDDFGGFYLSWVDNRAAGGTNENNYYTSSHLYAKHVRADSTNAWGGATGLPVCTAASFQNQQVMMTANGSILLAWHDERNAGSNNGAEQGDIYAQWVLPPGTDILGVAGDTLKFGNVVPNATDTTALNMQNTMIASGIHIDSMPVSDPHFRSLLPKNGQAFAVGGGSVKATYQPDTIELNTGIMSVYNNMLDYPDTVYLTGNGNGPMYAASNNTINFGNVKLGKTDTNGVTVFNHGNQALTFSSVTATPSIFTSLQNTLTLTPGDSARVAAAFTADSIKSYQGKLALVSNAYPPQDSIILLAMGTSAVREENLASANYLGQNYPNPFTSSTTIDFALPQNENITSLKVYDPLGREVADLTNHIHPIGHIRPIGDGTVEFNASGLPEGVYYYVLQTSGGRMTREMFVVR